jgi:hypothetical protein
MRRTTLWLALALAAAWPVAARADDPPPSGSPTTSAVQSSAKSDRPSWQPIPTSDDQVLWGLALQGHGVFVPGFLLAPFLDQYNTLYSGGFAVQGIRRKGTLDIVLSLDFSFYTPSDGNWRGAGKDPSLDTHYTQFHNLNFLALDVVFLYTHDLTSWLAIQVGGGVGLGVVFGEIDVINATGDCTGPNGADLTKCHPIVGDQNSYDKNIGPDGKPAPAIRPDTTGWTNCNGAVCPISPTDSDFQAKLNSTSAAQAKCNAMKAAGATPAPDCRDTAGHPYLHVATDKPPVLPVINFIVGFKFKLHRHFNFNVSGGFRNGFVVNGGPEYVF